MLTAIVFMASAAEARWYSCDETSPKDPLIIQHVDFTVDPADHPKSLMLEKAGVTLFGPLRPKYRPNYDNGYWFQTYGLDASYIASSYGDDYFLLTPAGGLSLQFDIQVHVYYGGGQYGWQVHDLHCVRQ